MATVMGILLACVLVFGFTGTARAATEWHIVLGEDTGNDEAVKVCLGDLVEAGRASGMDIRVAEDGAYTGGDLIVVGDGTRNPVTADLVREGLVSIAPMDDSQGYEVLPVRQGDRTILVVAGGSIIGDVYGLYWVWDRIRVTGEIPRTAARHQPSLPWRYTRIRVQTKDDIRRALRYRLNIVYGDNPLNLVPWNSDAEAAENEQHRAETRELASYAHALHMKFFPFGTDFTYHPSLLADLGASASLEDPRFWEVLKAKYRLLLEAMPELDGVATFTGEEQSYWGEYAFFDVMQDQPGANWPLDRRYRTFVKTVHEVVSGEFGKELLHRTWTTNGYEQQSQPEVYERIFTDDVPTENLFLIPSFTQNDRWWFQAYNPTVNRTPHSMMIVCEPMDYHGGNNVFPTFPAAYFQAGFESVLAVDNPNLKGASLDMPATEGWDRLSMPAYCVARLMWNYRDDPRSIARDYCAINFGVDLAEAMADICLLSPVAYKYGLYIEPAAYGEFNSLPHIRVGQFNAEGYPRIDGGKEHIAFLQGLYLRCKPWIDEAYTYLDHGLAAARQMEELYVPIQPRVPDQAFAATVGDSLRITRLLVETNNLYVKTFIAYFQYRDRRTAEKRDELAALSDSLKAVRDAFAAEPHAGFQLFGVDQLLVNAAQALDDLDRAEQRLASAPTPAQIERHVEELQERYAQVLQEHRDQAVKVLYWEGRVDGRDVLALRGNEVRIEHLRWDPIYFQDHTVSAALPENAVTVIPEDIESEPMHPFILEQPSEGNGYTVRVYLNDVPGGAHWFKFNLYYIDESPDALGLRAPWETQ